MPGFGSLWYGLVGHQRSLILSEMWCVMVLTARSFRSRLTFVNFCWPFYSHVWEWIGSEKHWGESLWLVKKKKKKDLFNCKFFFYISTGWMRGAYLRSEVFYSFCYKPSSREHLVNVTFFFSSETYPCGVFICLFIYSFCWWVSLKYICKSEEISAYNKAPQISFRCLYTLLSPRRCSFGVDDLPECWTRDWTRDL